MVVDIPWCTTDPWLITTGGPTVSDARSSTNGAATDALEALVTELEACIGHLQHA